MIFLFFISECEFGREYYEFGPVVKEELLLKIFLFLALAVILLSRVE